MLEEDYKLASVRELVIREVMKSLVQSGVKQEEAQAPLRFGFPN